MGNNDIKNKQIEKLEVYEAEKASVLARVEHREILPQFEWWDRRIIHKGPDASGPSPRIRDERITLYIEHPTPSEYSIDSPPPPVQLLKLTKKEIKKNRTQRRIQREREKEE